MAAGTTDEDLLEAWGAGDHDAASTLIDRYFEAIARFFQSKASRDPATQDELVQATFAACVEARRRFRGDGTFRSFLYSIAYNVLRKHYGRRRRDERVDFGTVSIVDLRTGASTLAGRRAERALLLQCMQTLPVEMQTALEFHYWEGMTAAEIAVALDVPVGAIKTRIRSARARLRDALTSAEAPGALRQAAADELEKN